MFRKISFVALFVKDLNVSLAFYRDKVGLPVKSTETGYVEFDTEGTKLALLDITAGRNLIGDQIQPQTARSLSLSLGEVENVDKTYEDLSKKGVNFIKSPKTQEWGQRTAYFTDPDGNIWEVYSMVK
jgi:catechol 2,3-dioxygenase-like lactoylglutathione lyase family enzyme